MESSILQGLTQLGTAGVAIVVLAYLLYADHKERARHEVREEERQDKNMKMMEIFLERIHANNMLLAAFKGDIDAFKEDIKINTGVVKEVKDLLHEHHDDAKSAMAKVNEVHKKINS